MSIFILSGFQSTAPLPATEHTDGEEREYNLQVVDQDENMSSLTSSNRSSIASDTELMVKWHTLAHLGILYQLPCDKAC